MSVKIKCPECGSIHSHLTGQQEAGSCWILDIECYNCGETWTQDVEVVEETP